MAKRGVMDEGRGKRPGGGGGACRRGAVGLLSYRLGEQVRVWVFAAGGGGVRMISVDAMNRAAPR